MTIVIIGAGLSGSLLLINLAKRYKAQPFDGQIFLVESNQRHWGKGIAYSSTLPYQPLNVTAQKMNLDANDPNDFLNWLHANGHSYQPDSFVSRALFGQFLTDSLAEAAEVLGAQLQRIEAEAQNVQPDQQGGYMLDLSNGQRLQADWLVLATGADTPVALPQTDPRIFNNPYEDNLIGQIRPDSELLILGTGLTMVDWAVSLHTACRPRKVYALSRRGMLPKSHHLQPLRWELNLEELKNLRSLREFVAHFNQNRHLASLQGVAWQQVLDAYRSHLCIIWRNFSDKDKKLFLRFLRPHWDSARFRMPIESADLLKVMGQNGQFLPLTAKVLNIDSSGERLKVRIFNQISQQEESFEVDYLLNCTGAAASCQQKMAILSQNLVKNGLAQVDSLSIGLLTDEMGCLIGKNNQAKHPIYCLGAVRKAAEWETTSIQSIRNQSVALAAHLAEEFAAQAVGC